MTGKEIKNAFMSDTLKKVMELNDKEEYYDCVEFAEKYGYTPSSVRQMLKRKQITKAVKLGNQWFISEDAGILVKQHTKKRRCVL